MTYFFGLDDGKVAVWTAVGSYGAAADVLGIQVAGINPQTISGELEGDDVLLDAAATLRSAEITLQFAFSDFAAWEIITGVTAVDSPTVDHMTFGRIRMPYFAFCGKVQGTSGAQNLHVFVPKCKLMDGPPPLRMEKGQYLSPEMRALAVYEGIQHGIYKTYIYDADTAVAIPPA